MPHLGFCLSFGPKVVQFGALATAAESGELWANVWILVEAHAGVHQVAFDQEWLHAVNLYQRQVTYVLRLWSLSHAKKIGA